MTNTPENRYANIFESSISFENRCINIYRYQVENNPIYHRFIEALGLKASHNPKVKDIPLLPIRAFKDGKVLVESDKKPDRMFQSSGTSNMSRSRHYILHQELYEQSILTEFEKYFPFEDYVIAFHLPGYDENPYSSLIWMAKYIIESDPSGDSQFVSAEEVYNLNETFKGKLTSKKILLFGAAFGSMDILDSGEFCPIENLEILETGGMKTHRREMTKPELRKALADGFGISPEQIHSEYGMCELLSQSYSIGSEWFQTPDWIEVSIRDPKNPSRICEVGEEGKIGIIDLANVYSCPFIITGDRGVMDHSGRFKVLGRWNPDDLRGCNFLIDNE